MTPRVAALLERQAAGERLDVLPFWGHSGRGVGRWVLSQWWEAPFAVDGVTFRTAEHWMMAQKALLFDDVDFYERILAAPTPADAKRLGRAVRGFDDEEWVAKRFAIVRTGSVLKFGQHPDLLAFLLATGDKVLVEASPRDRVWGIGRGAASAGDVAAWNGENLLGFALMDARDRLRTTADVPEDAPVPPWKLLDAHPYDIAWRWGGGEAHLMAFSAWWAGLDRDQRWAYERRYPAQGPWSGWYDPDSTS